MAEHAFNCKQVIGMSFGECELTRGTTKLTPTLAELDRGSENNSEIGDYVIFQLSEHEY